MVDILTHALLGYVLGTALSFRYDWLTPEYVTVCMMGALIPDMTKVKIVLSNAQMEAWLGVPFSWDAVHTLGGSTVAVLVGTVLVPTEQRRRVFALLMAGMVSHHAIDVLMAHPSGYVYDVLWPLSATWPPAGGLYNSTDRLPVVLTALLAGLTYAVGTRLDGPVT